MLRARAPGRCRVTRDLARVPRLTVCWHQTPSCARWWCRKSPSGRRRPPRPSTARRAACTTGRPRQCFGPMPTPMDASPAMG
jgi:hypothetical protein